MRFEKKLTFVLFFALILSTFVFAHGKKDTESKSVENLSSWQETFDINNKKKGKYNIFITATDLGGNQAVDGPFNLYIDPKSDLPVCGITNPHQDMRVVGNLNIVGTCADDDAVDHVVLILDGDEENPVTAKGKEFWSYYLDTRELEEGLHSIKATGYDINGLAGESVQVTWNLDRRQPQTKVNNYAMGTLVSGTVKFTGFVNDGNGIKKLQYSIDEGKNFYDLKLKQKKEGSYFELSIDSKKSKPEGGPAVLWLKATDNAGSEGFYSFLYVVDNAKPEVKILYPIDFKMPQFGKFVIAGYAKDDVGLSKLAWEFGSDSGEIELIPGNPYWGVEIDSRSMKETTRKFTIYATDQLGNVRSVSQMVKLDQSLDKPVTTITEPNAQTVISSEDEVYVRGFVTDEDGVSSIRYRLDNGTFEELETKGAFYAKLADGKDVTTGKHTITVIGKDRNGTEGNPVTVEFNVQGSAPTFSGLKVQDRDFTEGIEIHPETNASIQGTVNSSVGLKSLHYELKWGKNGSLPFDSEASGNSASFSIPINPTGPRGVVQLILSATDIVDRTTTYHSVFLVTNTTDVKPEEPTVVFSDSTISENGIVVLNKERAISGYFTGTNARAVELVPKTNIAKVRLVSNSIMVEAGSALGKSEPTIVRVTTNQGKTFDSKELIFENDSEKPTLNLKNGNSAVIDVVALAEQSESGEIAPVTISGTTKCASGIVSIKYRVLAIKPVFDKGLIKSIPSVEKSDYTELDVANSFEFTFDPNSYAKGIYVVEVTVSSPAGNKASEAVMIRNMSPNTSGKPTKDPQFVWIEGEEVYSAVVSQDNLGSVPLFQSYKRDVMVEGANELSASIMTEAGAEFSSKFNVNKQINLNAYFAKVGASDYRSGLTVPVEYGSSPAVPVTITAYVDTPLTLTGATYELTGPKTPGGNDKTTGAATLTKLEDGTQRWICEIPLVNIPARMTNIKLSVNVGTYKKDISGTIRVVRPEDSRNVDDRARIYPVELGDSYYDSENETYVVKAPARFAFYANVPGPLQNGYLTSVRDGLEYEVVGKTIIVSCTKEGLFEDVAVKAVDLNGVTYTSDSVKIMVDSGAPEVVINTPQVNQWVRKSVRLSGTAADPSGIKNAEYSLDAGETWQSLTLSFAGKRGSQGATFNTPLDISQAPDGIVKIDVRVFDAGGQVRYARTAAFKDTTPPTAELLVPTDSDIVNGDTTMIFKVTDNGTVNAVNYVTPPVKGEVKRFEIEPSKYVITSAGSPERPISDSMLFEFIDGANNKNTMGSWQFTVDSESDLPKVDIYLPTYEDVVTKDFTISGIVRDDDGNCRIFWKIDKNEYQELPEPGTSFGIDIPFTSVTDNEHTISMYAIDLNGVKGHVVERVFRVSTEEPKGSVESPSIDTSVKGVVTLTGVASDKNGIDKVLISVDNGNTYNLAEGTTSWKYTFDTRVIPNGTQVVFLRVIDKYGVEGIYSSLINVDNEGPEMSLELPLDYSSTVGPVFFSGNVFDNIDVTELYVSVRSFENKPISSKMAKIPFKKDNIITQVVDLSSLDNGVYNLEVTALDKAGNATHVSRNVQLNKNKELATINMLYPINGEHKNGNFNIYGEIAADKTVENIALYIDDKFVKDTQLASTGYFKFSITPEDISTGIHKYRVDVRVDGGKVIKSREQIIDYNAVGPWVTIDNFAFGDFAIERPFIRGKAGYALSEEDSLVLKDKKTAKEDKAKILLKDVQTVEVSFDNGKSFTSISKKENWRYRVENLDLKEGYHFMLVRVTMKNGETAIERTIIQIDNTSPTIRLISPSEGGRYNQGLQFSGLTNDKIGLKDVTLSLRKGDKSSYAVPSFIQGLYLDVKFWGATLFDIGAGLTFFDDNVKLQFQWGQFTQNQRNLFNQSQMRYGGDNIMGLKILATIARLPFSSMFGRDWEAVSASLAIGANFTVFNETNSGTPQILSALVGQIELPRFHFKKAKAFSSFSFYTEVSVWFIPTDVASGGEVSIKNVVPQFSEGFRLNVF